MLASHSKGGIHAIFTITVTCNETCNRLTKTVLLAHFIYCSVINTVNDTVLSVLQQQGLFLTSNSQCELLLSSFKNIDRAGILDVNARTNFLLCSWKAIQSPSQKQSVSDLSDGLCLLWESAHAHSTLCPRCLIFAILWFLLFWNKGQASWAQNRPHDWVGYQWW